MFTDNTQILQNRYGEVGVDDTLLFTEQYSRSYKYGYRIATSEVELAKKIARLAKKDEADLRVIGNSHQADRINWKQVLGLVCNKRETAYTGSELQFRKKIIAILGEAKCKYMCLLRNYHDT